MGAKIAAGPVARGASAKPQQAFEQSSAEVAWALQLAIQRKADLTSSAAVFIVSNPDATNAELDKWVAAPIRLSRVSFCLSASGIRFLAHPYS